MIWRQFPRAAGSAAVAPAREGERRNRRQSYVLSYSLLLNPLQVVVCSWKRNPVRVGKEIKSL